MGPFFLGLSWLGISSLVLSSIFEMGGLVATRHGILRQRQMLALALVLSAGALLLNPVGLKQVLYPLNVMLHQPLQLSQVEEWMPLPLSDPRGPWLAGTARGHLSLNARSPVRVVLA